MMATDIFKIDASWAEKLTKNESLILNDAKCRTSVSTSCLHTMFNACSAKILNCESAYSLVVVSFKKENALVVECPGVL